MPTSSMYRGFFYIVVAGFLGTWCLLGPSSVSASEHVAVNPVHPIAYRLDACMEEGEWEPEAALRCATQAHQDWQEEVDRLTERLDGVLGKDAREALERSDLAWRKSLEADLTLIDRYHGQLEEAELGKPELLPVSRQLLRNRLFEARVVQLQRLLDGLASLGEEGESAKDAP